MSMFLPEESSPKRPSVTQRNGTSEKGEPRRWVRFVPLLFLISILIGAVYAGFVATHTFTYPSTVSNIVNKPYGIAFTANELNATLVTCGSAPPCFYVDGTLGTTLTVWASSAMTGSGVTLTLIQIIPVSSSCSPSQPTNMTGLTIVPLPGLAQNKITLNEAAGYNYCIYYTSGTSIVTGSLFINYAAA